MIIAHRNEFFHLRRAIVWLVLGSAPWISLWLFSEQYTQLGGKWVGAALVSPVAVFFAIMELSKVINRKETLIQIIEGRIISPKFDEKISDFVRIEQEYRRPKFGFFHERFIVFRFCNNRSYIFLAKSVRENFETLSNSISINLK